jgi:hypothetical protein
VSLTIVITLESDDSGVQVKASSSLMPPDFTGKEAITAIGMLETAKASFLAGRWAVFDAAQKSAFSFGQKPPETPVEQLKKPSKSAK